MAAVTILHVSDVHFGERDRLSNQPQICNMLLREAHKQGGLPGFYPDLCIFSGDLTFKGADEEFASGENWLRRLIKPWPNCCLFVVPGNHEVVRPTGDRVNAAKKTLRGVNNSGLDVADYNGFRESFPNGWPNLLLGFSRWHENARANKELRLISNWNNLYGCLWDESINGLPIRLTGLNTALLSYEDNEQGKLVADLKYCNQALFDLDLNETLSLVVAHHPWTARDSLGQIEHWLVEWNRNEFEQRLLQETGAHLFLHGHVHKAQAESFSNLRGQHLVVLGAGATYQDPEYPLRFAFYRIDCNNQEIEPQTFRYNQHRGKWEVDRALSNSFRAILPKVGPRYPSSRPCDDFDRPCDDFNDLGFDILRTLHEINKTLDDLTQKAYDLMNLPNRHSAFEDAYGKYLKKYINDIQNKEVLFSTRKETMHKNIDNLGRLAQGSLVDARMVANLHLSNLWSQFQQFSTSHEFIINHMEGYSVSQHDSYYTDLYAKIKMAKGVCDAAIGDGISFNRSFTSFRLWVLMDH